MLDFCKGLTAQEDGEIRTIILSKLEQNQKNSPQMVAKECEQIENIQHDTTRIEERDVSKINAVKQKQYKKKIARKKNLAMAVDKFIITRNVHLERKNDL